LLRHDDIQSTQKDAAPNLGRFMAWVLNNPVVSAPIIGATKPHHLNDAAAAVDIDLTPAEVTALEEHYQVRPAGGF
ncbi:aldo/keto reductase, partial [Microbacterium aurantiacum]